MSFGLPSYFFAQSVRSQGIPNNVNFPGTGQPPSTGEGGPPVGGLSIDEGLYPTLPTPQTGPGVEGSEGTSVNPFGIDSDTTTATPWLQGFLQRSQQWQTHHTAFGGEADASDGSHGHWLQTVYATILATASGENAPLPAEPTGLFSPPMVDGGSGPPAPLLGQSRGDEVFFKTMGGGTASGRMLGYG